MTKISEHLVLQKSTKRLAICLPPTVTPPVGHYWALTRDQWGVIGFLFCYQPCFPWFSCRGEGVLRCLTSHMVSWPPATWNRWCSLNFKGRYCQTWHRTNKYFPIFPTFGWRIYIAMIQCRFGLSTPNCVHYPLARTGPQENGQHMVNLSCSCFLNTWYLKTRAHRVI